MEEFLARLRDEYEKTYYRGVVCERRGKAAAFSTHLHAADAGWIYPTSDPDGTEAILRELEASGATVVNLRLAHRSLAHYLEQLDAFPGVAARL